MTEEQQLSLHTETLFRKTVDLCKTYRYPLLMSLICAFISYTFIFTNKLPNHDELSYLFGTGATIKSGRWGIALFSHLIPQFSLPWFHGVATVLLISVGICLIVAAFRIRSHLLQTLLAGAIIVFPALLGTFGYMFTSIYYGISFLLAALAIWLLARGARYDGLLALVCCVVSVGIYQAYIAIVSSLLVTLLLQRVLFAEPSPKTTVLQGLRFLAFLALSLALYWGVTRLTQWAMGIEMGRYASKALDGGDSLWERVRLCYVYFWRILTDSSKGLIPEGVLRWTNCLLLVVTCAELLVCGLRPQRRSLLPLLLGLLVIYPASVTCIYLFVDRYSVHSLVMYGFAMVYVLAAVVIDGSIHVLTGRERADILRGLGCDAALAAMTVMILCNCFRSNVASLNMFLNYENNYALATSIITQVQMYPGYNHDMKVAIIGRLPEKGEPPELAEIRKLTGVRGFHTMCDSYENFWEDYLGFGVRFVSESSKEEIMETEEFQNMPTYPTQGYIGMVGEDLVVKLPPDD